MAEKQCNLSKNGGGMSKYSTSEVKTNDVWIDGKPIYRKVMVTTDYTSDFVVDVNIDTFISMRSVGYEANNTYFFGMPYTNYEQTVVTGYYMGGSKKWRPQLGTNVRNLLTKLAWIAEYTKTTD